MALLGRSGLESGPPSPIRGYGQGGGGRLGERQRRLDGPLLSCVVEGAVGPEWSHRQRGTGLDAGRGGCMVGPEP